MARLDKLGTLAIVSWTDTFSDHSGWTYIEELTQEPCIVHSVGWLIPTAEGGNPNHVSLYQSRIEDSDQVDSVLHIPVGMVVNVKLVTKGDLG
jgi:hypothetical protein